ncbi:MAG: DUF3291 domain-containing protein [Steroidobacterales bacterium]
MDAMPRYHLAQINVGRVLAPIEDPLMAEFVAQLDEINALADGSPGFVWRLQTDSGNATSVHAFEDDRILLNMSVWESAEALKAFVYESAHAPVMRQRRKWFERFQGAYMCLWWVEAGHIPSAFEAKERLEHLQAHGPTAWAFSFATLYPAPDAASSKPVEGFADPCPA